METSEEFDWGALIIVANEAEPRFRPGERGWIVGKGTVDTEELSQRLGLVEGTEFRIVEFEDGEDAAIPVDCLRVVDR